MPLLFADRRFLDHETGLHPESPARLVAVADMLRRHPGLSGTLGTPRPATDAELTRVHSPAHVVEIERFAAAGGGRIETDTEMCNESAAVARLAAGTACAAVDAVLTGSDPRAVCLSRPPGHHALPDAAMGFCLYNNVAAAAAHALAAHGLNRVLIVDWDVHHGNGTQDAFYADPAVTFFSAHRSPFYPGTGAAAETGTGPGLGHTFNLPLPLGIGRRQYLEAFESMLSAAAAKSRPELVLVSAGFDAHAADPIGNLGLESEDFASLTRMILNVAATHAGGRIVSLLEGGYNPTRLAESVAAHLEALTPPVE